MSEETIMVRKNLTKEDNNLEKENLNLTFTILIN